MQGLFFNLLVLLIGGGHDGFRQKMRGVFTPLGTAPTFLETNCRTWNQCVQERDGSITRRGYGTSRAVVVAVIATGGGRARSVGFVGE